MSAPGFAALTSYRAFERRFCCELPQTFPKTIEAFKLASKSTELDVPDDLVQALLQLAASPVEKFRHILQPFGREKPCHLFLAWLLGAMLNENLMISVDGLSGDVEEEEEQEEEEEDAEEAKARPVELVVLRARTPQAQGIAREQGLSAGMKDGCKAALVIEVKPSNPHAGFWQAVAEGVELARSNARYDPPAPVEVLLTDVKEWYFFTLEPQPQVELATAGSAAAAEASSAQGEPEFDFAVGGSGSAGPGMKLRMSRCAYVSCGLTDPFVGDGDADRVLQVLHRLYTALYPAVSLASLPALIAERNRQAEEAAARWVDTVAEAYTEQMRVKQALAKERAARADAEARAAEAEARLAEAEARLAAAAAAEAEARAAEAAARLAAAAARLAELEAARGAGQPAT